jgi:putative ABC transport system permease protein
MLYPFFYFIFPEKYLKEAPQTYFAALHVESEEIPLLENRIVQGFPNISTINIAEAAKEMGRMMQKLSKIVNFFAAFSILAGGLIIVSSILATRFERIKEAVYYKILGADSRFVLRIFFSENLLLGLLSSVFAIVMAQVAAWSLCHFFLGISYVPGWGACLGLVGLTIIFVVILGLLGSIPAMKKKPGRFLRQLN